MARPKMPTEQRKGLKMTVRMRLDLDEGLAAVALLRGTTRSGLVSQYATEQVRLEQERDRTSFDAAVEGIRVQRETERRMKSAQSLLETESDASKSLKAVTEERFLARSWCLESRPHDRLIEPLYDSGKRLNQPTNGRLCLLARGMRAACVTQELPPSDIILAPESRE